jgi:hypothetical protein
MSIALASVCAPAVHAQYVFDDFSSGNDSAWTRIDAPGIFVGIPSTYSVTDEQYRLQGPVYPTAAGALPTASFRGDGLADNSQVSVDVNDWSDASNQAIAVTGRGQQVAPTAFQFYALVFFPVSNVGPGLSNFRIDRWNADGSIDSLTANAAFPIVDPSHTFRMVLTLDGAHLRGDLFNLSLDPLTPFRSISVNDSGSGAISGLGLPGIMTYPNPADISLPAVGPADATFDNFRVIPAPGAAAMLGGVAQAALRRRRA